MTSTDPSPDDRAGAPRLSRRHLLAAAGAIGGSGLLASMLPESAWAADTSWLDRLDHTGVTPPFSFTYGGVASAQLLPTWRRSSSVRRTKGRGLTWTTSWTDPAGTLRVRWEITAYPAFKLAHWIVYFDNIGSTPSAAITDVLALDLTVEGPAGTGDWTIHTANGSDARAEDFLPHDIPLSADAFRTFGTNGGRPTNGFYDPSGATWQYLAGAGAPGYYDADQHGYGQPGMSASFTFTGTSVAWIGPRNIDCGISDVYIDGLKAASVDMYAPTWLKQQVLFSASDLPDGTHTIKVVVTADKNPAGIGYGSSIDAFQYGTGNDLITVNDNDPAITYTGLTTSSTSVVNGWPYFNVDWGGGGLLMALGWPGQWTVDLQRTGGKSLRLRGGMSHKTIVDQQRITDAGLTDLWLAPGESIRTPSIALQPWHGGDWIDAQNRWRRWFVQCHMPTTGGRPVPPLQPSQSNDYFPNQYDTAADELTWLSAYGDNDATPSGGGHVDHWWIDAGWSQLPAGTADWNHPGSWTPDTTRYPDGLTPINDLAHRLGMRTIVWFEPERVRPDTWLYDNHPEWLLKSSTGQTDNFLLDFTNPDVQDWAIAQVGGLIVSAHIDVYREDFNIDPLPFWTFNDPPDRRGITQIRYVTGHLRYWEQLKAKRPGLVIDTCASGGRRLDLETMGVAINLLRSDYVLNPVGNQSHILGVSRWLPLTGGASRVNGAADDVYQARSAMGPSFHNALDVSAADPDWAALNAVSAEWADLSTSYYGDFYPLTEPGVGPDTWLAWQFHDGDAGFVQAFRRPQAATGQLTLRLRGLTAWARYRVTDRDTGASRTLTGAQLMGSGLTVSLATAPAAAAVQYRRV